MSKSDGVMGKPAVLRRERSSAKFSGLVSASQSGMIEAFRLTLRSGFLLQI
jgi:hypothetical protein